MAFVNKLVNSTPWHVKIPYEKGISINIEPDGEVELSAEQRDDYTPGRPGSEEVRKILDFNGIFLLNPDLSYDIQALQALQACHKELTERLREFVQRVRDGRISTGRSVDDGTLEEVIESAGYGKKSKKGPGISARIAVIEQRIKRLRKAVEEDPTRGRIGSSLDPDRTCFVLEPPRQFPSTTALDMFLEENPEVKVKHEAFMSAQEE
jgi:hypothetical protein